MPKTSCLIWVAFKHHVSGFSGIAKQNQQKLLQSNFNVNELKQLTQPFISYMTHKHNSAFYYCTTTANCLWVLVLESLRFIASNSWYLLF